MRRGRHQGRPCLDEAPVQVRDGWCYARQRHPDPRPQDPRRAVRSASGADLDPRRGNLEEIIQLRVLYLIRLEQRADGVLEQKYPLLRVLGHTECLPYLLRPLQILAHARLVHRERPLVAAIAFSNEWDTPVLGPAFRAPELLACKTLEASLKLGEEVSRDY